MQHKLALLCNMFLDLHRQDVTRFLQLQDNLLLSAAATELLQL